jgi:hypothetical protein
MCMSYLCFQIPQQLLVKALYSLTHVAQGHTVCILVGQFQTLDSRSTRADRLPPQILHSLWHIL